ncbi:Crp/Fnr family transcriptional regulator [Paenibacillus farraposensis]|uniref:Crp/Fnr family transcriptional regulator n=1 Tax=Paenibacillus farraposensis TaxID=2807095 RepID=A0ABW4DAI6_9BACL|nr:Crp/Fnr family transcriptional regulator [Paenibacillus farraposensis]MCC3382265.1 Crp/Fnr family transcriptional regulator [Paenibacillus farraposensis]
MDPEKFANIVSKFPCFSVVPLEKWQNTGASIISLSAQPVLEEGHIFEHASFVLRGSVRIYKISPSGKELTLYRVKSGEVCVIMMASILGETGYEALAETEEETELLVLPVALFKHWMDTYKELNQFIYRLFIKRMISVTSLIEDITFLPMDRRVAELLLRKTNTNTNSEAPLYATHEALSLELGTAREVVSRVLKEFERLGWIQLGRGKIYLLQRSELEQLAQVK